MPDEMEIVSEIFPEAPEPESVDAGEPEQSVDEALADWSPEDRQALEQRYFDDVQQTASALLDEQEQQQAAVEHLAELADSWGIDRDDLVGFLGELQERADSETQYAAEMQASDVDYEAATAWQQQQDEADAEADRLVAHAWGDDAENVKITDVEAATKLAIALRADPHFRRSHGGAGLRANAAALREAARAYGTGGDELAVMERHVMRQAGRR